MQLLLELFRLSLSPEYIGATLALVLVLLFMTALVFALALATRPIPIDGGHPHACPVCKDIEPLRAPGTLCGDCHHAEYSR